MEFWTSCLRVLLFFVSINADWGWKTCIYSKHSLSNSKLHVATDYNILQEKNYQSTSSPKSIAQNAVYHIEHAMYQKVKRAQLCIKPWISTDYTPEKELKCFFYIIERLADQKRLHLCFNDKHTEKQFQNLLDNYLAKQAREPQTFKRRIRTSNLESRTYLDEWYEMLIVYKPNNLLAETEEVLERLLTVQTLAFDATYNNKPIFLIDPKLIRYDGEVPSLLGDFAHVFHPYMALTHSPPAVHRPPPEHTTSKTSSDNSAMNQRQDGNAKNSVRFSSEIRRMLREKLLEVHREAGGKGQTVLRYVTNKY